MTVIGSIHIQVVDGHGEGLEDIVGKTDELLRRRVSGLEELTIQVEKLS